jgi:hypothetical protein
MSTCCARVICPFLNMHQRTQYMYPNFTIWMLLVCTACVTSAHPHMCHMCTQLKRRAHSTRACTCMELQELVASISVASSSLAQPALATSLHACVAHHILTITRSMSGSIGRMMLGVLAYSNTVSTVHVARVRAHCLDLFAWSFPLVWARGAVKESGYSEDIYSATYKPSLYVA